MDEGKGVPRGRGAAGGRGRARKKARRVKTIRNRNILGRLRAITKWKLGKGYPLARAKIGTWNTRGLGAQASGIDQAEKWKILVHTWEARGWSAVLLTDIRLGPTGVREYRTEKETWTIVHHGKVAVAMCSRLTRHWRRGGRSGTGNRGGLERGV